MKKNKPILNRIVGGDDTAGLTDLDRIRRLVSDLEFEIIQCRQEAAKLSSKSDILTAWKLKIERDVLNVNHMTFP